MTDIEIKFKALEVEIIKASQTAKDYFEADSTQSELKSDGTAVTEVDQAIERQLRTWIDANFPDDAIVGEEEEGKEGTSGFVWHIDPIDGTDNFLRKIPFCAVSVARLGDTAEDSFGIVHNPLTGQTFASLMENGAYENERVTNLTAEPLANRVVVSIAAKCTPLRQNIEKAVATKFGRCNVYGSAALQLAYVAANRLDAYITYGLNTYDYAAGLFLVKAAGGAISVFENGEWTRWQGSIKDLCDKHGKTIFASHPDIHDEIRDFIGDPQQWAD